MFYIILSTRNIQQTVFQTIKTKSIKLLNIKLQHTRQQKSKSPQLVSSYRQPDFYSASKNTTFET